MADRPPDWFRDSAPKAPPRPAAAPEAAPAPAPPGPPARAPSFVPAEAVPDVAGALRAGEAQERARRRRSLAGGLALLVLLGAGGYGLKVWLAPGYLDHLRVERAAWKDAKFIAPGDSTVDPATGEATVPHDGFGVFADSDPEGARVSVRDRVLGETPLAAGVACAEGEPVTVRFELPGYRARQVVTRCRADAMVKLRVALTR